MTNTSKHGMTNITFEKSITVTATMCQPVAFWFSVIYQEDGPDSRTLPDTNCPLLIQSPDS